MKQTALTILAPLESGRASADERKRLAALQQSRAGEIQALLATKSIHYLSFFVVDALREADGTLRTAYVGLELNADGSAGAARALAVRAAAGLIAELFQHCERPPGPDPRALQRFLADKDCGADAYYLAFPGRGVRQIERDQALRRRVRAHYEGIAQQGSGGASALFAELQHAFANDPEAQARFEEPFFVRWTPRMGRFSRRAALLRKRCLPPVFTAVGAAGGYVLARERGVAALGLLVLAALVVSTALYSAGLAIGSPRGLTLRGRWLVLRSMIGPFVWSFAKTALFYGVVALIVCGLSALPTVFAWLAAVVPPLLAPLIALLCALFTVAFAVLFLYPWAGTGWAVTLALAIGAVFAALCYRLFEEPWLLAPATLAVACTLLVGAAALVACWLYRVRKAEMTEPQGDLSWDVGHLDAVQDHEDRGLQNHLATVSALKPGELRLCTLRRVLRVVSLFARVYFTRGDLGGIRTIHHARFLITPDESRLLFLGNYDLAFSSYLQEFNRVAGVTAVWSNTVGFPRSFLLVGDGARDEQRFKAFARRSQIPTCGWYSAYPDLSIRDIEAAAATRADLQQPIESKTTLSGKTRTLFGEPLSEADCDAALRRL